MPSRRLPLTLYLLRAGISPVDAVRVALPPDLSGAGASGAAGDEIDGDGWVRTWVLGESGFIDGRLPDTVDAGTSLLLRATPGESDWKTFLFELLPTGPVGGPPPLTYGGMLFQRLGADLVLWTFGTGFAFLTPGAVVERFGLHVGLNALLSSPAPSGARPKPTGVKSLTSAIRATVVRRSSVTATRPSAPTTMERVDRASDAAQSADITTHHPTFGSIRGGKSLHFEAPVSSLADLEAYGSEALRLYRRTDYKASADYNWIDYTVPVTDDAEVDRVLDEVLAQALATPPLHVDLVWADTDPVTNLTPSYVCFPYERSTPNASKRKDMQWSAAVNWLKANAPGVAGHDALRASLRFYHDDNSPAAEMELWRLLVAQVAVGSETYLVSDGAVWKASSEFIANIDNLLSGLVEVNPPWLPRFTPGELEGPYNQRAAAYGNHFLLDKNLVKIPGQTTFEPCDLLSADGQFMHVKRKTSAASISHLGAQAIAATRLLREDASARDLLDQALQKASPKPPGLAKMRQHCKSFEARPTAKVQLVIIGQWTGQPDIRQLSLLTRIGLNSWMREITCERGVLLVGT